MPLCENLFSHIKEGRKEKQVSRRPGEEVGIAEDGVAKRSDKQQGDENTGDHFCYSGKHRKKAITKSLKRAA